MIIALASGKGGTGKTTVAVNLALAAGENCKHDLQFIDSDVEEPNAHLFIKPELTSSETAGIPVPQIDQGKCNYCGKCARICVFNALAVTGDTVLTFLELCHGCGGCAYFCPEEAITEIFREIGVLEMGHSNKMSFAHGRLNPGEAMSPPLINAVKEKIDNSRHVIIDAPPGTSCPAVSSVRNCDYCLLVTEPTPFGLNDLDLAVEMLRKLDIPCGVVINRADLGDSGVEDYCRKEGIPVLMRFPWDRELARLYARGEPLVLHSQEWKNEFTRLWETLLLKAPSTS